VFIISKGYGDFKRGLTKRNWVANPDYPSELFDLKWTLFEKDVIYDKLNKD
jgi:hypothetical protein